MDETLELTPEEQESLAIGEEMVQQEQEMLAGKFESAEQLEKAYLELQSKLGQKQQVQSEEGEQENPVEQGTDDDAQEEAEGQEVVTLIQQAAKDLLDKGEVPEEVMAKFDQMSSRDVVDAMLKMETGPQAAAEDLSDAEVNSIQNMVGGKDSYDQLIAWSSENLPQEATTAFDNVVNVGDAAMIQLAVMGLQAAYQQVNGYEGSLATGRQARDPVDAFRSQAEVVQAMSDPRYDNDPAFRQDVFDKLARSNVDM